jgi:(p)ppGpp synthase/HD superfamily hydrolase
MGVYEQALVKAINAHDGQKRKYTLEPYVTHPVRVAGLVRPYPSRTWWSLRR